MRSVGDRRHSPGQLIWAGTFGIHREMDNALFIIAVVEAAC